METIIDKTKELSTRVELINNKLKFSGTAGQNAPVSIDYLAPLGDDEGYTSLELLLLSLSSCMGSSILTFLRRMRKTITACEIVANGKRRAEHPTGFDSINVQIQISSSDVAEEDMIKVIQLSEQTYCPVWAMLKGNVSISVDFQILQ